MRLRRRSGTFGVVGARLALDLQAGGAVALVGARVSSRVGETGNTKFAYRRMDLAPVWGFAAAGPFAAGFPELGPPKRPPVAPVFAIRDSASALVSHVMLRPKTKYQQKGAWRGARGEGGGGGHVEYGGACVPRSGFVHEG